MNPKSFRVLAFKLKVLQLMLSYAKTWSSSHSSFDYFGLSRMPMKMATCLILAMFNSGILVLYKKGKKSLTQIGFTDLNRFLHFEEFSLVVVINILLRTALLRYCSQNW